MRISDFSGRVCYFGKLPTRADFVRSGEGTAILDPLDSWVAHALELAALDPGWKGDYDLAEPIDFAFLSTRRSFALVGRLVPSCDASQRRFPFIGVVALPVENPLVLMGLHPILFAPVWRRLSVAMAEVLLAPEPRELLDSLGAIDIATPAVAPLQSNAYRDFLERQTLGDLEGLLRAAGHPAKLRRSVLAVGFLLEPLLTQSSGSLQRGLLLPLPEGEVDGPLMATFWMEAIAPFLSRADFEVCALRGLREGRPVLILSFGGFSARALQAALLRQAADYLIDIGEADWVEDYVDNDYAIKKLASYLEIPRLSLRQAMDSFREAFLGL